MYWILATIFILSIIISKFADKFSTSDQLTKVFFNFSFIPLFALIIFVVSDMVLGQEPPQLDLDLIDFFKWSAYEFGGWAKFIAFFYFSAAVAHGVLFGISWFINDVKTESYGFYTLFGVINGTVFLVGFFVFFEAIALILGIISTIITIIIGVKKLAS